MINTASNTVIATISPFNLQPLGIAITPDGKTAYVATSTFPNGEVIVIDTATNTITTTITVGVQGLPFDVGITSDGLFAFVTNLNGNFITQIDTSTNTTIAMAAPTPGTNSFGITSPLIGTKLYLAQNSSSLVSVLDTNTLAFSPVLGGIVTPIEIAMTPDGNFIYISQNTANFVTKMNTTTLVTSAIAVPSQPTGIAITPDGNYAYVSQTSGASVAVIDTSTNAIIATVGVGNAPAGIAFASVSSSGGFVVSGECKKNQFLTESDLFNVIRWSPPPGAIPTQYKIFCGSVLIATLPGSTLQFEHHNLKKNKSYSYSVFAEDETGTIASGTITIKCH